MALIALKFILDCFVTSKVIKKLFTALYGDYNILYFNEDSGNALFSCNEMGINKINLGDTYYNEDDPETIFHIRLLALRIKFEERKAL